MPEFPSVVSHFKIISLASEATFVAPRSIGQLRVLEDRRSQTLHYDQTGFVALRWHMDCYADIE